MSKRHMIFRRQKSLRPLFLVLLVTACSPKSPLEKAIERAEPIVQHLLDDSRHEIQLRYTQIKRDSAGLPSFVSHSLNEDGDAYFYPASTVKLPVAVLALQRLNELKADGFAIDAATAMRIYDTAFEQPIALMDSTKADSALTVSHLIKRIFLVSDNDAYNYLFDFLGRDYINAQLKEKGLSQTQIQHKFLFEADNTQTWSYAFLKGQDSLYAQPSIKSQMTLNNNTRKGLFKGKGYQSDGQIIEHPFDFSTKNRMSLADLEGVMKRVIFPEAFAENQRFNLTEKDYAFLRFWMSRNTLESEEPNYANDSTYYDSYGKFFIYGDRPGQMSDSVRIFNKVGYAYGTLTDIAYIIDRVNSTEFLLSATILVNENQVFNDNKYEYDEKGIPFLGALGRAVLELERKEKLTRY
jgi:hypothetical protein